MFEDPAVAIFNVALVSATMGLIIGGMYLVGGPGAVRRQALLLALFACGLLGIVFVLPVVERAVGFSFALPGLVLSGILLIVRMLLRRRESPAVAERRREMMRRPAVRALFAAWFAFVAIDTVLLLIISSDN